MNININTKILIMTTIGIAMLCVPYAIDSDTWFLLNHGRYVMEHGIPHTEPFTIHDNLNFIMQQWLSATIFWNVYSFAGANGLYILTITTSLLTGFLLYDIYNLCSEGNRGVAFVSTELVWFVLCMYSLARPWIFSNIIFLIEIYLLELFTRRRNIGYLIPLPFLSVLLINIHAAMWPVMFLLCMPFLAEYLLAKKNISIKGFITPEKTDLYAITIIIIAIGAFGFLNPYGSDAMMYLANSYNNDLRAIHIREVEPMSILLPIGKIFFPLLIGSIFLLSRNIIPIRYLLLFAGTAFMALTSARLLLLFLVGGMLFIPYIFRSKILKTSINIKYIILVLFCIGIYAFIGRDKIHDVSSIYWLIILLMSSGAVYYIFHHEITWKILKSIACLYLIGCISIGGCSLYHKFERGVASPKQKPAVDFLLNNFEKENIVLYTTFNDGAYAEFNGIRCYMDARAEVYFKKINRNKDIMKEYLQLQNGILPYKNFLARYDFTHALTNKEDILYYYLRDDKNWRLIYDGGYNRIYECIHPNEAKGIYHAILSSDDD